MYSTYIFNDPRHRRRIKVKGFEIAAVEGNTLIPRVKKFPPFTVAGDLTRFYGSMPVCGDYLVIYPNGREYIHQHRDFCERFRKAPIYDQD